MIRIPSVSELRKPPQIVEIRPAPDGFGFIVRSDETIVWLGSESRAMGCVLKRFEDCEVLIFTAAGDLKQHCRYRGGKSTDDKSASS